MKRLMKFGTKVGLVLLVTLFAISTCMVASTAASTTNQVHVDFTTGYWYVAPGELDASAVNDPANPLRGSFKQATSGIMNTDDPSDEPVVDATVTFTPAPGKTFETILNAPPVIPENSGGRSFANTYTELFTFLPGFSIERQLDRTDFDANGTQQLDIYTTTAEEKNWLTILVLLKDSDEVDAAITAVTGEGELSQWPADPRGVGIRINNPVVGVEYHHTITIAVTLKPGVSEAYFKPRVEASTYVGGESVGNTVGTSVSSGPMELGTWEWSAPEPYSWDWLKGEGTITGVLFPEHQAPVANAGPDQVVEQTSHEGAQVTLDGSGSTDDGKQKPLTYVWVWNGGLVFGEHPTVMMPPGTTTVTLLVFDGEYRVTDTVDITVEDTTPPEIAVSVDPEVLWPPNHKMVSVTATVFVSDAVDPSPTIELTSITCSDETPGSGDGHNSNDIQGAAFGTADYDFLLRAERTGQGDARVYTICYTATDNTGNSAQGVATIVVPHDRGKGK